MAEPRKPPYSTSLICAHKLSMRPVVVAYGIGLNGIPHNHLSNGNGTVIILLNLMVHLLKISYMDGSNCHFSNGVLCLWGSKYMI